MTPDQLAIAAIAFAAGVGFAILFSRWLLWNDVVIESAAHSGDEEEDDWGDDDVLLGQPIESAPVRMHVTDIGEGKAIAGDDIANWLNETELMRRGGTEE